MPKTKTSRKQLFRAALAIAGHSQVSWAAANKITPQWLSLVLNGHEESIKLTEKIDAFTREQLEKHTALAS